MKRYYSILCVLGLLSFLPMSINAQMLTIDPNPVCEGDLVMLSVDGSGDCANGTTYNFQRFENGGWNTKGTPSSATNFTIPSTNISDHSGMWRVLITDNDNMSDPGCALSNTVTLVVVAHQVDIGQPVPNQQTGMVELCENTSIPVVASNLGGEAANVVWSDNGAGGSFMDPGNTSTSYTPPFNFTGTIVITTTTVATGQCPVDDASVTLNYVEAATAEINTPISSICEGDTITLEGSFGGNGVTSATWSSNVPGDYFSDPTDTTTLYSPAVGMLQNRTITYETEIPDPPCLDENTAQISISVNERPIVNPSADQDMQCQGQSFSLFAGENNAVNSVNWTVTPMSAGGFSSQSTLNPTFFSSSAYSGDFQVCVKPNDNVSCPGEEKCITLTLFAEPDIGITSPQNNDEICQEATIPITTSFNGEYDEISWIVDPPEAGTISDPSSFSPNFTASSDYSGDVRLLVTVTGRGNCMDDSEFVDLKILANPVANLSVMGPAEKCDVDAFFNLEGTLIGPNVAYWSDGGQGGTFGSEFGLTNTYTPPGPGIYTLSFFTTDEGCGAIGSPTVVVEVVERAIPNVTTDNTTKCAGVPFQLEAAITGNPEVMNGTWSDDIGGSFSNTDVGVSTYTPLATHSGPIELVFTAGAESPCISEEATLELFVNPLPDATILNEESTGAMSNDSSICQGSGIRLATAGMMGDCQWTNDIGLGNPDPGSCVWNIEALDTSGVFTVGVTVTQGECSNSDEIEIEIFPDPNLDLLQESPCVGADFSLNIDADPGVEFENYSWERDGSPLVDEDGPSYVVPGVTDGSSGSYMVTAIDVNRCVWSASEEVDIQPIPDPVLIDKYAEVCQNAEVYYHVEVISPSSNFDWKIEPGTKGVDWDTTINDALLVVHWLVPGEYRVSVTEFLGVNSATLCKDSTFLDVTVTEGMAPDVPIIKYYDLNDLLIAKDPNATCYQWGYYDPDNREMVEIPGEIYQAYAANDNDASLDYNSNYDYWVEIWNDPTGNCDSPSCSTVSFRVEQGEGITPEEEEEEVFLIYPNPNKGQFTLKVNQMPKSSYQMKVVDLLGREVLQKEVFSNNGEINELVSFNQPLSVGVYVLYIYDDLDIYRQGKFVVVR